MHSILRFHSPRIPVVAGIWALVVGCGGATQEAASPSSTATMSSTAQAAAPTATAAPESAPPASWSADMMKEQKIAFMKKKVVPAMGPVFQAQNAARYADFGCKTCHGPEFKNPKDFLPRLTMKDGNITAFAQKRGEAARFGPPKRQC